MKKLGRSGFTILEVLISTMIFTVVLLICIQAITRIGQLYYKGVTSSQIQELTRSLSEEFSSQIQFGSSIPYPYPISGGDPTIPLIFCVGDNSYRAIMNRKLGDSGVNTVLKRKAYSGACSFSSTWFDDATELGVRNMRILKLQIIELQIIGSTINSGVWSVNIRLALGDSDIFDYPVTGSTDAPEVYGSAICRSGISGSQFCATSELSSTLLRRVKVE